MTRLRFSFMVFFAAIIIGAAIYYLYSTAGRQTEDPISTSLDHLSQNTTEDKRTYEFEVQALHEYGNHKACSRYYVSSDGMAFSSTTVFCGSPKVASRQLTKKLNKAVQVLSREQFFDEEGRRIGLKVVATFAPWSGSPTDSAEILWTRSSDFGFVQSSSLHNILEYRKDHRF